MRRSPMVRRVRVSAAVAFACVVMVMPGVSAQAAGALPGVGGAITGDLASGQGISKACLVWSQGGVVECFGSVQELKSREAQLRPTGSATGGSSRGVSPLSLCYSYLQLFSGPSFSGSELDIWDVGYWVNLSVYGFANVTVSFANGGCQSYLAKGPNGSVAWYPSSGPWVAVANMGLYWNDTLQSVYIA
jgi:hypothetical protein